jgi:hypothetical protein
LFWLFGGLLWFHVNLRLIFLFLWKITLEFWGKLYWIYRLHLVL